MSTQKPRSLQDILKSRQQEEFVGREEQLAFFSRNLRWEIDDPRRRFVINVSGQGGVGKTWLLRRFHKITEEAGVVTACTDETEEDVPGVMGRFTEQFEAQGHPLKTFSERYKVYRQRWREIKADPEARFAFPTRLGRAMTKGSLDLARILPGVGAFVELLDEEPIVGKGGEFAAYVARKVRNKEEVHLVLKPAEVLTPLFLADLQEVAEKHSVALFFDTYERTGNFLDSWLRDLLEGRHGNVPADILLVVAGRDELDRNHWAPYGGVLARLSLEPFTEEEARDYLARKDITDERVVEVILGISGRQPLLVATLAAESPDDPEKVGDPSGEAVERFLKWVEDPKQRQVALDAALPRWLNRDVLAALVGEEGTDALFAWLREMPFVEKRGNGWAYHDVVRGQMLRYKQQESPQGWAYLHGRLAEYYEGLRDRLGLEKVSWKDETWQGYLLEALYHRLCQTPQRYLPMVRSVFLAALQAQWTFAHRCADTVAQAGKDGEIPEVRGWGERLVEGLKSYDEARYETTTEMFTALLECSEIEEWGQSIALSWRGNTYRLMERYDEALADFNRAIELAPNDAWAIALRAETYRLMELYDEALVDFNHAIELALNDAWTISRRGETYRLMERYDEALADFNRAIELAPNDAWAIALRAETYRLMEQYEEALADFNQAIELNPDDAWSIVRRGLTYQFVERYDEALADFNRAIELNSEDTGFIALRGLAYQFMERYDEALADFNRAIELAPNDVWAISRRGSTYQLMGRYKEALAEFDRALEVQPNNLVFLSMRLGALMQKGDTAEIATICTTLGGQAREFVRQLQGVLTKAPFKMVELQLKLLASSMGLDSDTIQSIVEQGLNLMGGDQEEIVRVVESGMVSVGAEMYRRSRQFEQALLVYDRLVESDASEQAYWAGRGETYRLMKRYDEALADFNRAIKLEPDYTWAIACRGETYRRMGRCEEALADFDRAIELKPDYAWAIACQGETYRRMGRYEEALADLNRAIELAPDYTWAIACRGETCLRMGRHEEALADFNRAIELKPDYAWAIARRGVTYWQMERYEEALVDLNRAIELDPDDAWAIADRGETYRWMGRHEEALADFNRAIELKPDYAWAIARRGVTYRQMERYEETLVDLNRAIELDPDDAWAIADRGEAYERIGRHEEALADFDRAIELKPDYAWAIARRGVTYRRMGRYEETLVDLNRAIELDPDDAWAIADRGEAYGRMGRYEEALVDLNRAIELDPDDAWAIACRGETYRRMGRYEEALADLVRAMELDPDDTSATASRGKTYLLMKRCDEALADFNRAIELKTDNDWYLYDRALTFQILDQADKAQADLTAAIQYAQQGYKRDPQDWGNTFNLALYRLAVSDAKEAECLYREALSGGASPYQVREAIRDLDDFLTLFPDRLQARAMRDLLQEHL